MATRLAGRDHRSGPVQVHGRHWQAGDPPRRAGVHRDAAGPGADHIVIVGTKPA